jgi:hypothetical protein
MSQLNGKSLPGNGKKVTKKSIIWLDFYKKGLYNGII